jgi:hypothetical protein
MCTYGITEKSNCTKDENGAGNTGDALLPVDVFREAGRPMTCCTEFGSQGFAPRIIHLFICSWKSDLSME